jgi:hypothetical protein
MRLPTVEWVLVATRRSIDYMVMVDYLSCQEVHNCNQRDITLSGS